MHIPLLQMWFRWWSLAEILTAKTQCPNSSWGWIISWRTSLSSPLPSCLGSPRGWEGTSRLVVWLGGALLEVQVWIRRGIVGAKSMTLVQHTPDTDRKYPQMHPDFQHSKRSGHRSCQDASRRHQVHVQMGATEELVWSAGWGSQGWAMGWTCVLSTSKRSVSVD